MAQAKENGKKRYLTTKKLASIFVDQKRYDEPTNIQTSTAYTTGLRKTSQKNRICLVILLRFFVQQFDFFFKYRKYREYYSYPLFIY